MLITLLVCFLTALICPFLKGKELLGWVLSIIPFCLLLFFIMQTQKLDTYPWIPLLNINFSLYLDGLSRLFSILITGIGVLIIIYSGAFMKDHPKQPIFYAYLFFFMGTMLGLVLANDLTTLFIFWELISVASFLLVCFDRDQTEKRKAAIQGLLINTIGGLALLLSFRLITFTIHQNSLTQLLLQAGELQRNSYYHCILLLLLAGAFTKSAQTPFHFWLPNAMQAPTPVSAYLHSATMVQAGVYLLARFTPILGHTTLWFFLLTFFGSMTMLVAVTLVLRAKEFKEVLAYSTIMALGMLVFLLASGTPLTISAAILFLFVHALYKSGLFLCAGNIIYGTKTKTFNELKGLRTAMPITFLTTILLAASMAGLPPLLGFISKEFIYEAHLQQEIITFLLIFILIITNIGTALMSGLLAFKIFLGKKFTGIQLTKLTFTLSLPPFILAVLSLGFGLLPYTIDSSLISPAITAVTQQTLLFPPKAIHLWSGITPAFVLSLITLSIAAIIYIFHQKIFDLFSSVKWIDKYSLTHCLELLVKAIIKFAIKTTTYIQNGSLSNYLAIILMTVNLLLFTTLMIIPGTSFGEIIPLHAHWFDYLLVLFVLIPAFFILKTMHYLATIACLSVIGLGTTLIYITYGAPDVAITQILIDILTTIIAVLALYRCPPLPTIQHSPYKNIFFRMIIAFFTGLLVTALLLALINLPFDRFITSFYEKQTVENAHSQNIVNIIIVDFRAFDTLGEILVIALVGFGAFGLLKERCKQNE